MYYNQLLKLEKRLPKSSIEYKLCSLYTKYYYSALGNHEFMKECKQFLEKYLTR